MGGTRQRSPHSDSTLTRPPGLAVPLGSIASQHMWPSSRQAPSAEHALRGLNSARPADSPHRGLHRPARPPRCPTSRQHDAQPALRGSSGATSKDDGSESLKAHRGRRRPQRRRLSNLHPSSGGPGTFSTRGAALDPGTRQIAHWGYGAQTHTETWMVIRGRPVWTQWRARPGGGPSPQGVGMPARGLSCGGARGRPGLRLPQGPQRMGITPHTLGSPCRHSLPVPRRDDQDALPKCPGAPPSTPLQTSRIQTPRGTRDAPSLAGCSTVDTALAARADVAVCTGLHARTTVLRGKGKPPG